MSDSDPALILAIRQEIDQANRPIHSKLDEINNRLGRGDTNMALLNQRVDDIDDRCPSRQIHTDSHTKKKEMNPFALAAITAVITTAANMTFLWWLTGVGQHVGKGP